MADPITTHIAEHWHLYGLLAFGGGITTTIKIHGSNIKRLWDTKQDKSICVIARQQVCDDLGEIKDDVKWLVRKASDRRAEHE